MPSPQSPLLKIEHLMDEGPRIHSPRCTSIMGRCYPLKTVVDLLTAAALGTTCVVAARPMTSLDPIPQSRMRIWIDHTCNILTELPLVLIRITPTYPKLRPTRPRARRQQAFCLQIVTERAPLDPSQTVGLIETADRKFLMSNAREAALNIAPWPVLTVV